MIDLMMEDLGNLALRRALVLLGSVALLLMAAVKNFTCGA
jgi:hypothetical protein